MPETPENTTAGTGPDSGGGSSAAGSPGEVSLTAGGGGGSRQSGAPIKLEGLTTRYSGSA